MLFFKKDGSHEPSFDEQLLTISVEVKRYLISKGATKEDAEDAVQNTFYKMLILTDDLSPRTIRAWFYRVAMNNLIDMKRREKTGKRLVKQVFDADDSSQKLDVNWLERDQLVQLLTELKEEYREILMLKYYYELSYEEIGTVLNYSEHNVRTLLYRARKAARILLEEEDK
ncbi:RNA polymerase sigma factor [Vagococcus intermedius]|uniref:RNA polymerase sigma factor n=1 Tax=Vagococcus intermedius TaxID=2991418 RepID=A0AAF0CTQ5_9ENTE|nr:RNA polymerase sigma factor [Vagococcus intermedius]WEG72834.1 RNA polymerase sigma factor [Vagococcus intermedius]WEG74920.1 RNA polymerase sigma factor [Vagococcus intermedius]